MYALTYKNQLRSTEASLPVRSGCSLRRRSLFGELLRHGSLGPCHGDQGASAAGIQRDEAGRRQAPQLTVNASGRTPELNKGAVSSCAEDRQRARPGALPRSQKLSRSILGGVSCKEVAPFLSDFPKYPKALEARSSAKPVDLLTISLPQSGDTQRQLTAPSTSRGRPSIPRSVGHLFGLPG